MLACGIIFVILGIISVVIGNEMNNDVGRQVSSFLESGKINDGEIFETIGWGLVILGGIFIIVGIARIDSRNKPRPIYAVPNGLFVCRCCGFQGSYSPICPVCNSKNSMVRLNVGPSMPSAPASPIKHETEICPYCGATLVSGKKFCDTCGKALRESKTCANCGAEIRAGAAFCANCGNKTNS